MSIRSRALIGACQVLLAFPLYAQDSTVVGEHRPIATDTSSWRAGVQAGKDSAEDPPVALRSVVGFVAGVPSGFLGVAAFTLAPQAIVGLGAGVGIIAATASVGSVAPPAAAAEYASSRGPEFERGFRTGYADRLRSRRASAAAKGGAAGAATGFAFLLWLFANLD